MYWREITIESAPSTIQTVANRLTAGGFEDLVIEDQTEFEEFLEENRSCWDYIDEELQKQLEGLSRIKLYLEDTDTASMERLKKLLEKLGLTMQINKMAETNWEESWKAFPASSSIWKIPIRPLWSG